MTTDKTPGAATPRRSALLALMSEIRVIIGGLFCVYGVTVGVAGLFDSQAELDKAQGVNINLWTGLAMLTFGAVFLLWAYLRPARRPEDGS
jgi:xanthine/uracil/vitamin C permease (AzgA family)